MSKEVISSHSLIMTKHFFQCADCLSGDLEFGQKCSSLGGQQAKINSPYTWTQIHLISIIRIYESINPEDEDP